MGRLIDADVLMESIRKALGIKGMAKSFLLPAERTIIDQIDSAPTVSGWISVKDRLPEKYLDVLVLVQYPKVNGYTGHYMVIAWKSTDDDSWDSDDNNFNNDPEGVVTHWMPLPESPKEEENA